MSAISFSQFASKPSPYSYFHYLPPGLQAPSSWPCKHISCASHTIPVKHSAPARLFISRLSLYRFHPATSNPIAQRSALISNYLAISISRTTPNSICNRKNSFVSPHDHSLSYSRLLRHSPVTDTWPSSITASHPFAPLLFVLLEYRVTSFPCSYGPSVCAIIKFSSSPNFKILHIASFPAPHPLVFFASLLSLGSFSARMSLSFVLPKLGSAPQERLRPCLAPFPSSVAFL